MATHLKNLSSYDANSVPDASGMKIGVIVADYNSDITYALRDGCLQSLQENGVKEDDIYLLHVPGAFELTVGAQILHEQEKPDALICLGCVIKGDTMHDEYINHAVANGITQLSLDLQKPVIFGLLTTNTLQQAVDRAGGKHGNKGVEGAITAIKMVALNKG